MLRNTVLRTVFEPKTAEVRDRKKNCTTKSFGIFTPHQILFIRLHHRVCEGQSLCHVWIKRLMNTGFLWGNLKERDHLVDLCVNEGIILK